MCVERGKEQQLKLTTDPDRFGRPINQRMPHVNCVRLSRTAAEAAAAAARTHPRVRSFWRQPNQEFICLLEFAAARFARCPFVIARGSVLCVHAESIRAVKRNMGGGGRRKNADEIEKIKKK